MPSSCHASWVSCLSNIPVKEYVQCFLLFPASLPCNLWIGKNTEDPSSPTPILLSPPGASARLMYTPSASLLCMC